MKATASVIIHAFGSNGDIHPSSSWARGLAGLAAARILQRRGYEVTVFEARERIGGRVWTLRDGFGGMHGEAGGELIDADQSEIRSLARELGLSEQRILRGGFAHYRLGRKGRRRMRSA